MRVKRSVAEFERTLIGMQGGISLYRKGIDEFFVSQGFPLAHERLEAARRDLEALGMYERCRDALTRAEALIRQGPEYDEEANMLFCETNRALMKASGTYEAMRRRYSAANDASKPNDNTEQ